MKKILLKYNGIILHSSFINFENKAILFSAPSGTGKSTQADLWKKYKNAEITLEVYNDTLTDILNRDDEETIALVETSLKTLKANSYGLEVDSGKNDIVNLFNSDKIFSYPKSTKFISTLLKIATNSNDIILDFFAGSGTTAQAVMELNAEDKGNREFILVQLDDV